VIGPIVNRSQLDGLLAKIGEARASGARELLGGEAQGLVLPPHVFGDVTPAMELAREEIFGPIVPILRADDEAHALALANDTEFGLSSCVFSGDMERGVRFARQLQAGMSHVNDQPVNDLPFNPFGGEKNSGIGRFNGRWAIDAFTSEQWLTLQHTPRPYPLHADQISGPWAGG
jgi:aldehyde dehydrogenase (NAD+)